MPVRFLSDAQREQLSRFPAEFEAESLDRFFTLSGADLAEVRRRHGDENRLGWSLQLCGLRMLGFCPDEVTTAPPAAVGFVARQVGVDPGVLAGYGSRAQTRTEHVNQVKAYLGFRSATAADLEEVRGLLDCHLGGSPADGGDRRLRAAQRQAFDHSDQLGGDVAAPLVSPSGLSQAGQAAGSVAGEPALRASQ